jgi:hypothetical protein
MMIWRALAFELLLKHGFHTALAVFALVQLCLAILAVRLIRGEDSSAGDRSGMVGTGS